MRGTQRASVKEVRQELCPTLESAQGIYQNSRPQGSHYSNPEKKLLNFRLSSKPKTIPISERGQSLKKTEHTGGIIYTMEKGREQLRPFI